MGREIRRVPPNWEHPKTKRPNGRIDYQPMHDWDYQKRLDEWDAGNKDWENKTHKDFDSECTYEDWAGEKPDPAYYIPYTKESATWYQSYETVSEGTPVSPPFETEDELICYLATNGDFWDQSRGDGPWTIVSATNFVKGDGFRPTMMVSASGIIKMAKDQ